MAILETLSLLALLAANAGVVAYLLGPRRRPGVFRPAPAPRPVALRQPCPAGDCWLARTVDFGPSLPPTAAFYPEEQ